MRGGVSRPPPTTASTMAPAPKASSRLKAVPPSSPEQTTATSSPRSAAASPAAARATPEAFSRAPTSTSGATAAPGQGPGAVAGAEDSPPAAQIQPRELHRRVAVLEAARRQAAPLAAEEVLRPLARQSPRLADAGCPEHFLHPPFQQRHQARRRPQHVHYHADVSPWLAKERGKEGHVELHANVLMWGPLLQVETPAWSASARG